MRSSINLNWLVKGFVLVLILSSCNDLLEESPKAVVAENFYSTNSDVEAAINAAYAPLRSNAYLGSYVAVLDAHTDWGYGRGSRAVFNSFNGINTGAFPSGQVWNMFYLSIRNANIVIQNAPGATSVTAEDLDQYIAEAKFLRAFSYFQLVRIWGDVPLRTEITMESKDIERSSVDKVYDLILADLEEAETYLPEEQEQKGRATKFAAKTLLADVYLHLEMFEEAHNKAKEVMDANIYSLVPTATTNDFYEIFGPDVLTTSEEIFYFKFSPITGYGSFMPGILNHPSTGLFNFGGFYAHYSDASLPFYRNWNDNDLRKGLWSIVDFGLGDSTIVSTKFVDSNAVSVTDAGTDQPVYRYAEVLLIFAEAAARSAGAVTPEAMEALNQVHRRAYGVDDPLVASAFDFNASAFDLDSFIDLVVEERGYEFIYEGKRWFTLKRTGKAQEKVMENRGITIADRHFLWPIPESEINYNDAINSENQNPGY